MSLFEFNDNKMRNLPESALKAAIMEYNMLIDQLTRSRAKVIDELERRVERKNPPVDGEGNNIDFGFDIMRGEKFDPIDELHDDLGGEG